MYFFQFRLKCYQMKHNKNLIFVKQQGRKRPLDTLKRMIKRREREGKRKKGIRKDICREGGRDIEREGEGGIERDREREREG